MYTLFLAMKGKNTFIGRFLGIVEPDSINSMLKGPVSLPPEFEIRGHKIYLKNIEPET